MGTSGLVSNLLEIDPALFSRLHVEITEERIYRYLQPLADTLAPSQTVCYTRAPQVQSLLEADGLLNRANVRFDRNYQSTGNSVLLLGRQEQRKQVWLLAHLDIISYLIETVYDNRFRLTPICYHMMEPGRRAAVAMEYKLGLHRLDIAAYGDIVTENDGQIFFEANEKVVLRPGQRVCFNSKLEWNRETGELRGSLDDIGAVVSLLLAASLLADYDVELLLGLTDEEEGIAGSSSQTICRGGARLLRYFEQPDLVIASDIHEAVPMIEGRGPASLRPGDGASFAEKGSRGRDAVTPPHLYELQRQLAQELATQGIRLCENIGGYVSRTESVNAMLRTPNIALVGFLGANRHFERDVTSASIKDLVDLARAVVCYVLFTQTPIWRKLMAEL